MASISSKRKASVVSQRRKKTSNVSARGSQRRGALKTKRVENEVTYTIAQTPWENQPDREELDAKALLGMEIRNRIASLGLSQRVAAKRMGIAQADVSKIVNVNVFGFSLSRLSALLARLGADVKIHVAFRYTAGPGTLRITAAKALQPRLP